MLEPEMERDGVDDPRSPRTITNLNQLFGRVGGVPVDLEEAVIGKRGQSDGYDSVTRLLGAFHKGQRALVVLLGRVRGRQRGDRQDDERDYHRHAETLADERR